MKNQKGFISPVLITIIVLLVIGCGIYIYANKRSGGLGDTNKTEAGDYKTYEDKQYGISFKYPANLAVKENYVGITARTGYKIISVALGDIPGVNASFVINAGVSLADCNTPVNGPIYTKTTIINGVKYYTGTSGDHGMGEAEDTEGYSTVLNNICYQVNLVMDYGRDSNDTYTEHFDKNTVEKAFTNIFSTLTFSPLQP